LGLPDHALMIVARGAKKDEGPPTWPTAIRLTAPNRPLPQSADQPDAGMNYLGECPDAVPTGIWSISD
jgi:hypothetical protein